MVSGKFHMKLNATKIHRIVCDRCSVNKRLHFAGDHFSKINIFFRHLTVEFAAIKQIKCSNIVDAEGLVK